MTQSKTTVEIVPTLIIGLGGTGTLVLSEMKRLFVEHPLFDKKVPPMVSFLSIDSDSDSDSYVEEEEAAFNLTRDEKVAVSAEVEDIKTFLSRHTYIKQWFPVEETKSVELTGRGAKQKRYLGRLAFFASADRIQNKIRGALAAICNRQHLVSDGVKSADTENMNIFIITSLCGGTGSGMFIDLAYAARELSIDSVNKKTQMTGFMLTSEAFHLPGFRGNIQKNCAAALMELDYFMRPDHVDFSVSYSDTFKIKKSAHRKAFDLAYIVNGTEIPDHNLVGKSIAHSIFSNIITNSGKKEEQIKDNIVYDAVEKNEGKFSSFSIFGFGSLLFPALKIKEAFSYRLASQMMSKILEKYDHSERNLKHRLRNFLSNRAPELSMDYVPLLDKLLTREELNRILPPAHPAFLDEAKGSFFSSFAGWEQRITITESIEKQIQERIGKNWEKYQRAVSDKIEEEVNGFISHYDLGIEFCLSFTKKIYDHISELVESYDREYDRLNQQLAIHLKRKYELIKELEQESESFFTFQSTLRKIGELIIHEQSSISRLIFDTIRLKAATEKLLSFLQTMDTQTLQILKKLRDTMWIWKEKEFRDSEKSVLDEIYSLKKQNTYVDKIIIDETDIGFSGWYYDYLLTCNESPDSEALWDAMETECLQDITISDWRSYSTRPELLKDELVSFCADKFSVLDNKSIEEFLTEKAKHLHNEDKSKTKQFYIDIMKDIFFTSRPTTAINQSRGKYSPVPTVTFGVPDISVNVLDKNIIDASCSINNAKTNIVEIGFRNRLIMSQTVEAIPITGITTVDIWANAYENRDRYLHAVGKSLGVDWDDHKLIQHKDMSTIEDSVYLFFMGLATHNIAKRNHHEGSDKPVYYIPDVRRDDEFSLSDPSGIPLANTIEESVRELCEKNDKRLTLESRVNASDQYKSMSAEEKAELLHTYFEKLRQALEQVTNERIKKAYVIILKVLHFKLKQLKKQIEETRAKGRIEDSFSL